MKADIFYSTLCALSLALASPLLNASDIQANTAEIRYDQRRFTPAKIEVRTGLPLVLTIINTSGERIEFESFKLHREKVIEPGETATLRLPALRAGRYDFFDDFHPDVPEGVIVVR